MAGPDRCFAVKVPLLFRCGRVDAFAGADPAGLGRSFQFATTGPVRLARRLQLASAAKACRGRLFQLGDLSSLNLANFAQFEREIISERTYEAMQQLKAQGVKMGGPPYGYAKPARCQAPGPSSRRSPDSVRCGPSRFASRDSLMCWSDGQALAGIACARLVQRAAAQRAGHSASRRAGWMGVRARRPVGQVRSPLASPRADVHLTSIGRPARGFAVRYGRWLRGSLVS